MRVFRLRVEVRTVEAPLGELQVQVAQVEPQVQAPPVEATPSLSSSLSF